MRRIPIKPLRAESVKHRALARARRARAPAASEHEQRWRETLIDRWVCEQIEDARKTGE